MRNKKVVGIVNVLLLLLFLGYYGSITLFPHSHLVEGRLVSHSHPFSSTPHNHSTSEVQHISTLSEFHTTYASLHTIEATIKQVGTVEFGENARTYSISSQNSHQLRAPPHFATSLAA